MLRHIRGTMGDDVDVVAVGTETHVALTVTDTVHHMDSASGHFTPDEARMIAAALVDVADALDNVDDGTPPPKSIDWLGERLLRDANAKLDWVRAQHTRNATAHVDTIHRGLTSVYGDGCMECETRWPCDTIMKLDE